MDIGTSGIETRDPETKGHRDIGLKVFVLLKWSTFCINFSGLKKKKNVEIIRFPLYNCKKNFVQKNRKSPEKNKKFPNKKLKNSVETGCHFLIKCEKFSPEKI